MEVCLHLTNLTSYLTVANYSRLCVSEGGNEARGGDMERISFSKSIAKI